MYSKFSIRLIIYYCYFFVSFSIAEPIVQINQGLLNGTIFKTRHRTASAFLGIPYAKPPINDLRFKNPEPADNWIGIRSAQKEADLCAQLSKQCNVEGKEDCLYLNVFTPLLEFNNSMGANIPVMVLLFGSGYAYGTSGPTLYGPNNLLDKDVILVTLNHRLGILGFLTTGDSTAPGNFGLKDQVLALKWVQKNIRRFGGDPKRVTLFGMSAGASCVNLHALSDLSNGLFHRYILESGSALAPFAFRKKEDYRFYMETVAENVECLNKSSEDFVNCLRNRSLISILRANPTIPLNLPEVTWMPTDEFESEDAFLTDSPKNLITFGRMKDLPSISGTTMDEGLVTTLHMYEDGTPMDKIQYFLDNCINNTSKHYMYPNNLDVYRRTIQDYYFNKSLYSLPRDKLLQNFTIFLGDSTFYYPQMHLLEILSTGKSPFYFYSFGYFSLALSNTDPLWLTRENHGVFHGGETAFLFSKSISPSISTNDEKIVNLMVDLWTSFAINGKPSSNVLEDPFLWQPYMKNKSFLQIGNLLNNTDPTITMENNYFSQRMDFWKANFPLLL